MVSRRRRPRALDVRDERGSAPAPTAVAKSCFRKEGDFWTISYDGKSLRLKDSKGVQYVAELIRHEGEEIHAAGLAAGTAREMAEGVRDRGNAGEILDPQARSEYRERLRDLEADFLKDEVSERARKAVASRIRDSIDKIGKEHRALALHLENAIRTGTFCSYRPDRSTDWDL